VSGRGIRTTAEQDRIDFLVGGQAQKLSERLQAHRAQLFPPDAKRELRKFTSGEAVELPGVKDAYLRLLPRNGRGPSPEVRTGGRRYYTPQDLQALRDMLEAGAKSRSTSLPGRRDSDHLQVITVINVKGGSGKTTTAARLAQKMALDGDKVPVIDLDPQASLSALHGFQPEFGLLDAGTLYDAIRYDDPLPLRDVIRKTYFTTLDTAPGNLDLMEFGHGTPLALKHCGATMVSKFLSCSGRTPVIRNAVRLSLAAAVSQPSGRLTSRSRHGSAIWMIRRWCWPRVSRTRPALI